MEKKEKFISRELVQKVIRREKVKQVVKGELCFDDEVVCSVLGSRKVEFAEKYQFIDWLGLDLICIAPGYWSEMECFSELQNCHFREIEKWTQTSLFTFGLLDGAFEWGIRYFGFVDFLTMIMKNSEKVSEFVLQVEKLNFNLINRLVYLGINGIVLADDIAGTDRLFIKPSIFRELFLRSLERQVKKIKNANLPVFFHSDGNYIQILQDIVEAGFDGVHCIDKTCGLNIDELNRDYGNSLCFWGHLGGAELNYSADSLEMAKLVRDIRILCENSSFILGTNSGLYSGINIYGLKQILELVD